MNFVELSKLESTKLQAFANEYMFALGELTEFDDKKEEAIETQITYLTKQFEKYLRQQISNYKNCRHQVNNIRKMLYHKEQKK